MSASTSSGSRGGMFTPRSTGGKWVLLIVVLFLIWMTINHPSEAVVLFQDFFGAIGDLFSAVFTAYQEGRNAS